MRVFLSSGRPHKEYKPRVSKARAHLLGLDRPCNSRGAKHSKMACYTMSNERGTKPFSFFSVSPQATFLLNMPFWNVQGCALAIKNMAQQVGHFSLQKVGKNC